MLAIFTELLPLDTLHGSTSPVPATDGGGGGLAVHCGTLMELVTPAAGPAAVGYTFGPAGGAVSLPPVWRCGCGFQLDAWIRSPYAPSMQEDAAGHILALSA